jgi:hypothetical protein
MGDSDQQFIEHMLSHHQMGVMMASMARGAACILSGGICKPPWCRRADHQARS